MDFDAGGGLLALEILPPGPRAANVASAGCSSVPLVQASERVLIGAFPLIVLVEWLVTGGRLSQADIGLGLLFLLGAILEQINYYHYQLMYFDSRYDWPYLMQNKRLRIGSIAKMLTPSISDHDKVKY